MASKKASKTNSNKTTKRAFSGKRPFPNLSLEESIKIATTLKDKNGGNPWEPKEITKVLKYGVGNKYYYLTASSKEYGFTSGTREAAKISLGEIGKKIVYAKSKDEVKAGYKEAFFKIDIFKKVYEYYKGGELPELEYLKNTLITEFNLGEKFHDEFTKVYKENILYLSKIDVLDAIAIDSTEDEKDESKSIILGTPKKKNAKISFVAMPFTVKTNNYPKGFFDEVLNQLITPAGVDAGFKVETANKKGTDVIHSTIINDLTNADLVIVDLTEHNPNVLFELGWRMAHDKPVALIRAKGTGPIFDVDHMLRVFEYDPNLWSSTVKKDIPKLTEHIKATWNNKDKDKSYYKILKES
jgi:hypothetical protein